MRRHDVVGVAVGNRAGQQRLRHVLVGDRAQEALDRAGAHRGGAGVRRRGERTAVHHGVADLDAGRPAVEQDAAGLAVPGSAAAGPRSSWSDSSACTVAVSWPSSRAATEAISAASAQRTTRLEEPNTSACSTSEEPKLAASVANSAARQVVGVVTGLAARDEVGGGAEIVDAVGVALGDVRRQHGCRGGRGERVAGGVDERVQAGAVRGDDEAGVGAELPRPHGQRADEGPAEVGRRGW